MERTANKGFDALFVWLLQLAGGCAVMALGLAAALTRDATCCTVFAMGFGVALALLLRG